MVNLVLNQQNSTAETLTATTIQSIGIIICQHKIYYGCVGGSIIHRIGSILQVS